MGYVIYCVDRVNEMPRLQEMVLVSYSLYILLCIVLNLYVDSFWRMGI